MLKIRLQRQGRKGSPAYRLVLAEHTMPIQGRFIEKLGHFIPQRKEETMNLNTDRIKYWISVGAQPSQTVARLLFKEGVTEAEKFIKSRPTKPSKAEQRKAEEAAKAAENAAQEAALKAQEAEAAEVEEKSESQESDSQEAEASAEEKVEAEVEESEEAKSEEAEEKKES